MVDAVAIFLLSINSCFCTCAFAVAIYASANCFACSFILAFTVPLDSTSSISVGLIRKITSISNSP
jgi:hypothetical protein